MRWILVLILFGVAGCGGSFESQLASQSPQEVFEEPPTLPPSEEEEPTPVAMEPERARWETSANGSRAWTTFLYSQTELYGQDLLSRAPADIAAFCPRYATLPRAHKKDFWVYLISSIAQFESNFNPALSYTEDFTDSTGARVVSRGLLQLSIESARAYGCELPSANDLHDPYKNLLCGLRILNRWVGTDGVIRGATTAGAWRGGARYWSVLRRDAQYNSIRSWTAAQSYCSE